MDSNNSHLTTSLDQAWAFSAQECLGLLSSSSNNGLSTSEASLRRSHFGENKLIERPPRSVFQVIIDQLKGFLNALLGIAAVGAWAIGNIKDASMIAAVVVFNTILGFLQEYKAEKTLAALKGMIPLRAQVRRNAIVSEIAASEIVPGDIVLLDAGSRVPADGRLLVAQSLEINESALTGESIPTIKRNDIRLDKTTAIADRSNMAFMNTVVTRGRAEVLVTATGLSTEMGKMAEMIGSIELPPTPLQKQLDHLGKRLAAFAVGIVSLIGIFEYFRGDSLTQIAMESISLSVASMPEGLPAVVTVTLALGLYRMAKSRAVVKRLAAVETLGSTNVICTDKTGTLTLNKMTAEKFWIYPQTTDLTKKLVRMSNHQADNFIFPLALCNDVQLQETNLIGDPTETALVKLSLELENDVLRIRKNNPRIAEIPFESERKYMATFHLGKHAINMYAKGAPDVLLSHCRRIYTQDGFIPLTEDLLGKVQAQLNGFAGQGMRVIALASREIKSEDFSVESNLVNEVKELDFIALIGLIDPPRAEARFAISTCKTAGIDVKMITGDHSDTALAIARELGLSGSAISGTELALMSDSELSERISGISVFARVAPEHKLRIVRALKASGKIVAMTGDGVNDAPALKASDIGIAMGSGTEVAKEAATMVLLDDNFETIVKAVLEGRTIYDNIIKFVRFQLSTNFGALLTIFLAPILSLPSPLSPIQILWVAMIMDGPPAIALGLDPSNDEIMKRPPRSFDERILSWTRLRTLLFYGIVMATGTLSLLSLGVQDGDITKATTLAFTTFVLFQFFNAFNARSEGRSAFGYQLFTNFRLWGALAVVVSLQVLVVHWNVLQDFFGTVPLTAKEWGLAVGVSSILLVLEELRKLAVRLWQIAFHSPTRTITH